MFFIDMSYYISLFMATNFWRIFGMTNVFHPFCLQLCHVLIDTSALRWSFFVNKIFEKCWTQNDLFLWTMPNVSLKYCIHNTFVYKHSLRIVKQCLINAWQSLSWFLFARCKVKFFFNKMNLRWSCLNHERRFVENIQIPSINVFVCASL